LHLQLNVGVAAYVPPPGSGYTTARLPFVKKVVLSQGDHTMQFDAIV